MELFKRRLTEKDSLSNNLHSFFTILWGQCSPGIQSKIKTSIDFLIKKEDSDCDWPIEEIRQVIFNFTTSRYRLQTLLETKLDLMKLQQGRMSTIQYFDKYFEKIHPYEREGGSFGQEKGVLKFVYENHYAFINAQPGPKPKLSAVPSFTPLGEGDILNREQIEQVMEPYKMYVDTMKNYHRESRPWENVKARYDELRAQVSRDTYVAYYDWSSALLLPFIAHPETRFRPHCFLIFFSFGQS